MSRKLPITKPVLGEEEAASAREAILSGWVAQGPKVKAFEDAFAANVGAPYACAVSNCSTGLHLALLAVGVKPGDVVLTVSHSFIATANAARYCGAHVAFVDIDVDTFNISVEDLKNLLKNNVTRRGKKSYFKRGNVVGELKAILVVHQIGMPCDLKEIITIAKKFNLPVIEDAACAIGSEMSFDEGVTFERVGAPHGDIACFSFHPRKVITTGEGGMLTTRHKKYDEKFRLFRQHAMSVNDLSRHNSLKVLFEEYTDVGYNYRMTDIQAAIGLEQLKRLDAIVAERRELATYYRRSLEHIDWLVLQKEPRYARSNWQSFAIRLLKEAPIKRDALMQKMLDVGIASRRGIMNAHQEKPYLSLKYKLPNSQIARDQSILLPLFHGMTHDDIDYVVKVIKHA